MNGPHTHEGLTHGHSRIIWLLDDVDAHLTGLREDSEVPDLIVDELSAYTRRFRDELADHIAEEEAALFPRVRALGSRADQAVIERLHAQHEELLANLRVLDTLVEDLREGSDCSAAARAVAEHTRVLRDHLVTHSKTERQFLFELRDRLSGAPFEH